MPFYRGSLTFELWFSADDQQHADERVDAIIASAERHPEIFPTTVTVDIEEVRPDASDLADMRAGI